MPTELLDDSTQDAEEEFIFNEYAIDDSLDPLNRLLMYYQSDFSLQRLVLVRELASTAQFAGYAESARSIVPLLTTFTQDAEPVVRQALVEQLYPLAEFFVQQGSDAGYQCLLNAFLPTAFELLVDKNVEVGVVALEAIQKLAQLVHKEDVQSHLLNVVMTLAHDERAEDYRVVAAQLFNDLAPQFGSEFSTTVVLGELELLSNDSSFTVRRTVGSNLGGVCAVLTTEEAQRTVLSLYITLCGDEIWGVRQACAESIEKVASGLPESMRVQFIVPAFQKLLEDDSRWVRTRAYESLGRLLHTLRSEDISPELLRLFTDMAFQSDNVESPLSEYCAYCFPAVVQVIGPSRWNEVADAYATMLKDVQWKVRKSLAYSLHEMAALLGTTIAEEAIVPAFELLLRDLDDIKRGAVLNAERFLALVTPATRDRLVPLLCHVPLESENWRLRNEVAKRIGAVAVLLSPDSPSFPSVLALVSRLLDDSVMEVRTSTYEPVAIILKHLRAANDEKYQNYLASIVKLATAYSFRGRQMFAYVTEQVVKVGADDVLESALLDGIVKLAMDPVVNTRLVVDSVAGRTILRNHKWAGNNKVQEAVAVLQQQAASQEEVDAAAEAAEAAVANTQILNGNEDGGGEAGSMEMQQDEEQQADGGAPSPALQAGPDDVAPGAGGTGGEDEAVPPCGLWPQGAPTVSTEASSGSSSVVSLGGTAVVGDI
ncbi:conserved hypothetical protein [Leishmania major strain Friedlin]|uniref:Phosphatase 2A Regulatory Subunit A helical domain-containing protein n=1 Tax=Leishmania major TaxID=5664 RepID=Q4QDX5_LEIMA|nr:conserved hypothetical protein [Leishmania major strain Friedlin]CAG9572452.1 HEAT_repeats/HEAT_repeat_-_putative [Leishmania major strain Friedlin]CAJ03684.1 conserved hypothetical protein [Leishmania major strain Friedlin]|eukprot:XP_001682473.1 conserved hypothetical protein [Leishmania major strain Friedlin]